MDGRALKNCRVLIVEDEYFLADELRAELAGAGAVVAGVAGTVGEAMELAGGPDRLDGAVLDVNLAGNTVFPVADRLLDRNVPFVFTTGYDSSQIPARFRHVMRYEKPVDMQRLMRAVGHAIGRAAPQGASAS